MICLARKTPKDGKEENIRVRVTPEQKQRLVEYAERHYQSMSGVVCQALDLLYAREEQQVTKSEMELFWSLSFHKRYGKYKNKTNVRRKNR